MGTVLRPELSVNNQYWIEKHRYYELKHFCLQYPFWKKACSSLDGWRYNKADMNVYSVDHRITDPTAECVELRARYKEKMNIVEKVAVIAAGDLHCYILKGITEGVSYDCIKAKLEIPCCKEKYYEMYRKFFYLLSKEKE